MNWLQEWAHKAKELIKSPVDFYDNLEKKGDYSYPIKFSVTSGILAALIVFVFQEVQLALGIELMPLPEFTGLQSLGILLVAGLFGGTVGFLINAAFIHLFARIFGFDGYQKTVEAVSYPTAISTAFGWIPLVNFFAFIYMVYAEIRGMENFHGMSTGKAAASVVLGFIVLGIVIIAVISLPLLLLDAEALAPTVNGEVPLEAFL